MNKSCHVVYKWYCKYLNELECIIFILESTFNFCVILCFYQSTNPLKISVKSQLKSSAHWTNILIIMHSFDWEAHVIM